MAKGSLLCDYRTFHTCKFCLDYKREQKLQGYTNYTVFQLYLKSGFHLVLTVFNKIRETNVIE